jgi:transposase
MYSISKKSTEEIRERMKEVTDAKIYKRLQAVALRGEGKKNKEVGSITGYHPDWVGHLSKTYCKAGIEGLLEDGRKGGNNRNMNEAEATEFLDKFKQQAEKGEIITVEEIAKAYDEAVGKEHASNSTVYYFLHNHGWRLITPQKQHPGKATEDEIEASKKLTMSLRE